jgi:hypothetical protein
VSVDFEIVSAAAARDDIDRAAHLLLEWYPTIDTTAVDTDSFRRAQARSFVSLCGVVLEREASIGHPREADLLAAMREMHDRHEDIPMAHHRAAFQRVGEVRARYRTRAAIADARRSLDAVFVGLPRISTVSSHRGRRPNLDIDELRGLRGPGGVVNPFAAMALADEALSAAQTHDDTGPLDRLVQLLEGAADSPALLHLVRARQRVVRGQVGEAMQELALAASAPDRLLRWLRPQIYATHGMLKARSNAADLDEAIELCRTGRRHGLRWWRRTTAADTSLAMLLVWRATLPGVDAVQQQSHAKEAVRLARRRCRWRHSPMADDIAVLHDALTALAAATGVSNMDRQQDGWRRAVARPWDIGERARLAQGWAEWAVGIDVPEFAAEAYRHLVTLAAQDAATRHSTSARQRVLTAAQEYAEEAGYWLGRAGHYREAVLALETGRAVTLTTMLGRDPLALEVSYNDITAQTEDGAVVYIAAARAGGYALVVAAHHDPQFVDLPRLDRATVLAVAAAVLPGAGVLAASRSAAPASERPALRDLKAVTRIEDRTAAGLRVLWASGMQDLLLLHARGTIVTFVPVGVLSLLPLHAVGDPGPPGDERTGWRHAGNFSAIRYAPNARSLARCRATARALAPAEHALLAADAPLGAGGDRAFSLIHVARETDEVTRRFAGRAQHLLHSCTWAQFQAVAADYTVWHVACHAAAHPNSIMDSRLSFADKEVTLDELRRSLPPGPRRLAVLSACQTNVTGAAMPNEMVGLPSALIEVGFAGVIASAWQVDDLATTYLMTAFYQWWRHGGEEPIVALNRAQQWLRAARADDLVALLPGLVPDGDPGEHPYADPRFWAAFAYTGA